MSSVAGGIVCIFILFIYFFTCSSLFPYFTFVESFASVPRYAIIVWNSSLSSQVTEEEVYLSLWGSIMITFSSFFFFFLDYIQYAILMVVLYFSQIFAFHCIRNKIHN